MKLNNKTLAIVVVSTTIIAGGAGFFGGMKYQESRRGSVARQFGGGQMNRNGLAAGPLRLGEASRQGFRPVAGEIIKSDATSVTVKLADGSTKIVILTDKTTINKAEAATKDDLKTGQTVAVFGTENADGTMTAQTVQLNPEFRMRGLGGASPSAVPKQ